MRPSSAYSIRLDEKVIILMVTISILALFLTAFRYKNYKPCSAFQFTVYANYFNVGHHIFFKTTDVQNSRKWEWDFGDKTVPDKTSGPISTHVYKQPGRYIVTLTINGQCKQYQNVVIHNAVKDSVRSIIPQVMWPEDPVIAGQNVLFHDITNGANRWEWYIGEGKESKRFVTQDVEFTFSKPGLVPVKLFINGNIEYKLERIIKVENAALRKRPYPGNYARRRPYRPAMTIKDKPDNESLFDQEPQKLTGSTKPHAPQLTKELFLQMIRGVIGRTVSERDFAPYLCGNRDVRVSFNGDDISFPECIERLHKVKKVKSLKASAYTDGETNCILNISIVYERKTFLGLLKK